MHESRRRARESSARATSAAIRAASRGASGPARDQRGQRAPLDQLHREEQDALAPGRSCTPGRFPGWRSRAAARASRRKRIASRSSSAAPAGQHLERDAPAERLLLGLVDDAHAAAADLAHEPELAEPPSRREARAPAPRRARAPRRAACSRLRRVELAAVDQDLGEARCRGRPRARAHGLDPRRARRARATSSSLRIRSSRESI